MVTKIEIQGYVGTQIAGILKKSVMKSYNPVILQLGSKGKNMILLSHCIIFLQTDLGLTVHKYSASPFSQPISDLYVAS